MQWKSERDEYKKHPAGKRIKTSRDRFADRIFIILHSSLSSASDIYLAVHP